MKTFNQIVIKTVGLVLLVFSFQSLSAQVLDLESTSEGMLIPRMTTAQKNAIASPSQSELVYDTDTKSFWYYENSQWNELGSGGAAVAGDEIKDADNDTKIQVEEGSDDDIIRFDIAGSERLLIRNNAGGRPIIEPRGAFFNVFLGEDSGRNVTSGAFSNTFVGAGAGQMATSALENTIMGTHAGANITTNGGNTLIGRWAGRDLASGTRNVIVGLYASRQSTAGNNNSILGSHAAHSSAGDNNTMLGYGSGYFNDGSNNVFIGKDAGRDNVGDNQLYVDNTNTSTPLIYGKFDTNTIGINTTKGLGALNISDLTNDKTQLYLLPKSTGSEDSSSVFLAEDDNATYGMEILYDGANNELEVLGHNDGTINGPHVKIRRDNGQVAIGKSYATGFRLSVDGKIACEEVLVDLEADWPDYVFQSDYELNSLNEVKQYINEKGHLPGVPSAKEIEDNGIVLGEMNRIQMEKIEELTLYILQLEEKTNKMSNYIDTLEARTQALENNK